MNRRATPETASQPARLGRGLAAATAALGLAAAWSLAAAPARADEIRAHEWPVSYLDIPAANQISTGSGITVAVLDSGVVGQRVDLIGQVTSGPDFVGGVGRPGQTGWGEHGTCMASIINGHGRGGGDGMLGVAPGAHVLSIRVIRDSDAPDIGRPTKSDTPVSDGIRYAVDHGAQVISMSIGGADTSGEADADPEADAIRYALDHNVVVVVAAGNSADRGNEIQYPGAQRGVISVAAVDVSGRHADFSTTSWDVSVAAPGVNVPCDAATADDEYLLGDGTSQATAYIAGIAALLKAENGHLSPAQIRNVLEKTARETPAGGRDDQIGFGIVDPVAALKAAAGIKGSSEIPGVANKGPAGGHFGFATAHVTEVFGSFGARPRAIVGGAGLLGAALVIGLILLWRGRRRALAALAVQTQPYPFAYPPGPYPPAPPTPFGPPVGPPPGPPMSFGPPAGPVPPGDQDANGAPSKLDE
jgi:type VII secretion-associated serine protease mycosin